MKALDLPGKLR